MTNKRLLQFGIAGTIVSAICCFTPALVVLLGILGLSAWLAWLDALLIPLLVVFMAITAFALMGAISYSRNREGNDGSAE